jgi:FixJ family two-component response regulator
MSKTSVAGNEIFIVDDDADVCHALAAAFAIEGYQVKTFADAASFIAAARARTPACVLLDIRMPAKSGLDLLKELDARNYPAPIFIMSDRGNIATAVEAINDGAYDFIEKRLGTAPMIAQVRETVDRWTRSKRGSGQHDARTLSLPGYQRLTPRERDVLREVMSAASSKEAARTLGMSPRTIENRRGSIMLKLGARNAMDLARIVLGSARLEASCRGFVGRMRVDAARFAACRESLGNKAAAAQALERIKAVAHGLAGGAGIFGFGAVSCAALVLEAAAIEQLAGYGSPGKIEDGLKALLDCIEHA